MLSPKRLLLFLFAGTLSLSLYFALVFGVALSNYFSLRANAPAKIVRWEVKGEGDAYQIHALYTFEAKGRTWEGASVLHEDPPYWNEAAAIFSLQKLAKKSYLAWYHPKHPERSSLENPFPWSPLLKTAICLAVLAYFSLMRNRLLRLFAS